MRPFVLYSYSLRHTFLTGLGESGCDDWTLGRIAGHSSITISSRYVHPSENAVLGAAKGWVSTIKIRVTLRSTSESCYQLDT